VLQLSGGGLKFHTLGLHATLTKFFYKISVIEDYFGESFFELNMFVHLIRLSLKTQVSVFTASALD